MGVLHKARVQAILMLAVAAPLVVASRPNVLGEAHGRHLLLNVGGVDINIPPISDINVPPINIPSLPNINQVLGNLNLPSLPDINLNNLPDWNTLQQVLQSNIPVNPNDISAPAVLNFNLTNACPTNANTSTVFNNAVRLIAARGVGADPSNVVVTGVNCTGDQTQVNLAFLGNSSTTNVTQLQGYANQLQNNADSIFGSVSQGVLNGLGILGVSGVVNNPPSGNGNNSNSPSGNGNNSNGTPGNSPNNNNTYTVPGGGSVVFSAATQSGAGKALVMFAVVLSSLIAWVA